MKLICCNFKMNLLKKDILNYIEVLNNKIDKSNLIIFPSIPYISYFKDKNFIVGSQNISFKEFGSLTGDTSILQLKELGIDYTLIGHSERRKYSNDNNFISKKIHIALKNNIKVILCIGEKSKLNIEETKEFLKKEIDIAFSKNKNFINEDNLIIAYEPIWAIGNKIILDYEKLLNTIKFIKEYIFNTYNIKIKLLYGGNVNIKNIDNLKKIKEINGYLIGNFSLKPENILELSTHLL